MLGAFCDLCVVVSFSCVCRFDNNCSRMERVHHKLFFACMVLSCSVCVCACVAIRLLCFVTYLAVDRLCVCFLQVPRKREPNSSISSSSSRSSSSSNSSSACTHISHAVPKTQAIKFLPRLWTQHSYIYARHHHRHHHHHHHTRNNIFSWC
jgi:hypothetical protein